MSIHAKGIEPEWFTPASQSDEEDPARFYLQPLTAGQANQVMTDVELSRYWPCGPRAVDRCLRWSIKDWSGVYDSNGEPAPCSAEKAVKILPPSLQQEIATRVVQQSVFTEDDRKNS